MPGAMRRNGTRAQPNQRKGKKRNSYLSQNMINNKEKKEKRRRRRRGRGFLCRWKCLWASQQPMFPMCWAGSNQFKWSQRQKHLVEPTRIKHLIYYILLYLSSIQPAFSSSSSVNKMIFRNNKNWCCVAWALSLLNLIVFAPHSPVRRSNRINSCTEQLCQGR